MSRDLVKVRAIRPHDTTAAYRRPGDEYERPKAEAERLAAAGVLEIVAPKARATKAK